MKINWKQTVYQPPKKKKITLRMEFNRSVAGFAFALTVLSLVITVPYLYIKFAGSVNNDLILWNIIPLLLLVPVVLPQLLAASGAALNLNGALIRHELRKIKTLPRWLQLVTVMPVINNFLLPLAGWRIARRRRIFPVYILLLCSGVMSLAGWYNIFCGRILSFAAWGLLIAAAGLELTAHHCLWRFKYTLRCRFMIALSAVMWCAALIFVYIDTVEVKAEYAAAGKNIAAQGVAGNESELIELYYANTRPDEFYTSAVKQYVKNIDRIKKVPSYAGFLKSTLAEQLAAGTLFNDPDIKEFLRNADEIAAQNRIQRDKLPDIAPFVSIGGSFYCAGFNSAAARSLSLRTGWAIQAGDRAEAIRLYELFRAFNTNVIACDPLTLGALVWLGNEFIRLETVKYMLESRLLTPEDRSRIARELALDAPLIVAQGIIGLSEEATAAGEADQLLRHILRAFLRENPHDISPDQQKYIQWLISADPGKFALFRIFNNHIRRIQSISMNYLAQCAGFLRENAAEENKPLPPYPQGLKKNAIWGVRDQKNYLEKVIKLQKQNREMQTRCKAQ